MQNAADPNIKNNYGSTPLHYACYGGHVECARHLLWMGGADQRILDNEKRTPWLDAEERNHAPVLELLEAYIISDVLVQRQVAALAGGALSALPSARRRGADSPVRWLTIDCVKRIAHFLETRGTCDVSKRWLLERHNGTDSVLSIAGRSERLDENCHVGDLVDLADLAGDGDLVDLTADLIDINHSVANQSDTSCDLLVFLDDDDGPKLPGTRLIAAAKKIILENRASSAFWAGIEWRRAAIVEGLDWSTGEEPSAEAEPESPSLSPSLFELGGSDADRDEHEQQGEALLNERTNTEKAFELKAQGNELVQQGKFGRAVISYTEAILLDPTNHVIYSNRSTAYTKLVRTIPTGLFFAAPAISPRIDGKLARVSVRSHRPTSRRPWWTLRSASSSSRSGQRGIDAPPRLHYHTAARTPLSL